MKSQTPFSIKKRIRSFGYAITGLLQFLKTEHNLWIHAVFAIIAFALGFILEITRLEWAAILIVIGMVLSAEAFNTCIEKLIDYLAPEEDKRAEYIKDLAAGAVFFTAVIAAIVGCLVFIPKLISFF